MSFPYEELEKRLGYRFKDKQIEIHILDRPGDLSDKSEQHENQPFIFTKSFFAHIPPQCLFESDYLL